MKHHFLSKTKIPVELPKEMQDLALELSKSKNQDQCLKKAYDFLTKKYRGYKFKTYTKFFDVFINSVDTLWGKNGFLHCHNLNYLLRILLVASGFFENKDIHNKWTLVWYISPHQYLTVNLKNGKTINIDLWAHAYNIPFGGYAHGFNV